MNNLFLSSVPSFKDGLKVFFLLSDYVRSHALFSGIPSILIFDNVLGYGATTRLMFRKGKGECRVWKVFNAPNLAKSKYVFIIPVNFFFLELYLND